MLISYIIKTRRQRLLLMFFFLFFFAAVLGIINVASCPCELRFTSTTHLPHTLTYKSAEWQERARVSNEASHNDDGRTRQATEANMWNKILIIINMLASV